ncbi:hypothetical protein HYS31_08460 [Candidatus Woesearchaeota archaeon]|nr:hypothetical protein [Candidatus Woesearchaeota archaeon]
MDVYDINSNSWSNGTSGGAARYSHVAALYNNKIYFWGGWTATFDSTNLTDIYDIANDSWSNGTPGGLARFSSASALYNGKLYIFGGSDDATIDAVNRLDIYDIAKDSWSQGVSGGTARDFLYSTAPVYNGRIYFWGGINTAENRINSMDILDIGDRQSYLSFYENGENMLSFRTGSNINLDYGLLSITGGNLGVGTTHPKARLHVNDSSAVGSLLVTNVSGTAIFFVNGSSGKVGIGTTSPTQKLEISGGSVLIPTGAKYLIGGTTEGIRGSVNSFVAIQTNAADRIVANYGGAIQFLDESANVLMQIQSTGKVGIGATSPNVTFHVSGAANVSGRLSYGTLAANSPHFFETIGKAEPLCIKSKIGKYVGCMIDENFEFVCRIDDRCSRKYLDASLSEEIEHLNRETPNNLVNENNLTNNAAPVRDSTDTSASAPNAEIAQINDNDYKKQKIERLSKLKSGIKEKEVTVKQAIVQLKLEQLGHVDIDAIESEEDAVGYTSKTKKAREEQGNVGINTTVPARTLTVQGTLNVSNPGTSGQLFMDSSGSVGIGTTTPTEVLSVNGNVSIEGTNCRDSGGSATCNNFVDFAELFDSSEPVESGDIVIISFENPPSKPTAGFSPQNPQSTSKSFQNSVDGKFQNSVDAKFQNPVDSSSKIRLTALQNPVDASQNNTQKTPLIYNTESNANNNENSIENPAPDFASAFKVKKSAKPYDSKVIGIVSTQPAIVIEGGRIVAMGGWKGQNNTLKPAIALAGRVPVKVTNENGPIQKGDLLTTSSKAGYGMKFSLLDPANAKDFSELKMMLKENENRRNAVLGKSLENCDQQECKILAFVSMQ